MKICNRAERYILFVLHGRALVWRFIYDSKFFSSFLLDRSQTVITSAIKFQPVLLEYAIPQGSVLGFLLNSLYTTPIHSIISKYPDLRSYFYADDNQIYLSFSPDLASSTFYSSESCIKDIFSWMIGNKLSVNPNKTEYTV